MIDLLLAYGADGAREAELLRGIEEHDAAVLQSAGRGDARQVARAEAAVRADPAAAFAFDTVGNATLTTADRSWRAGRFEPVSLGVLRTRAAAGAQRARLGFWVLDGARPATDVGVASDGRGPHPPLSHERLRTDYRAR